VPTRVNSPADNEQTDRNSNDFNLTFTAAVLNSTFTALNSVDTGIFPKPNNHTMGDGPVTGQEVRFDVTFTVPIILLPGHYFFVPQVLLSDPDQHFLWLSAPKPIVPPGTPITLDLQSWIRNASLAPDWLRIGTDIVGGTTFNATFSLDGATTTLPAPVLDAMGLAILVLGLVAGVPILLRLRGMPFRRADS